MNTNIMYANHIQISGSEHEVILDFHFINADRESREAFSIILSPSAFESFVSRCPASLELLRKSIKEAAMKREANSDSNSPIVPQYPRFA